MPWVYLLELDPKTIPRTDGIADAAQVQADWQSIAGEGISHAEGGVTISGDGRGVVVSTPREPNYADLESDFDYVLEVTEDREIPSKGSAEWKETFDSGLTPGVQLGNGFTISERE